MPVFQSTHSITECDCGFARSWHTTPHFNPRTPLQSATLNYRQADDHHAHFNPRTPLQSATVNHMANFVGQRISIHALHYRVRPVKSLFAATFDIVFQSTHSITECDATPLDAPGGGLQISIHALHYRVRRWGSSIFVGTIKSFQSTHSITECDRNI